MIKYIFKMLIIGSIGLLISSCGFPNDDFKKDNFQGAIQIVTLDNGLKCAVRVRLGGLSCNWEEYNNQ